MTETLLIVVIVLLLVVIGVQVALFFRKVQIDLSPVTQAFQAVEKALERTDKICAAMRLPPIAPNCPNTLKGVGDSLNQQLSRA